MKIFPALLFLFFVSFGHLLGEDCALLQNVSHRNSQTLNGLWHYIVDMNETGYYNYRWEAYDEQENLEQMLISRIQNRNIRVI